MGVTNQRINWIDWARIIGMYAIILGHFFPAHGKGFIYSFSVPIFFFLSGYLTKEDSCDLYQAWKKIWTPLIVPMLIFLTFNWIFLILSNGFSETLNDSLQLWREALTGKYNSLLGTLWFVYDLIIIKFVFLITSRKYIRIITLISLVLMLLLDYYSIAEAVAWVNIWGGFLFMGLGNEVKKLGSINNFMVKQISSKNKLLRIVLSIILAVFIFVVVDKKPIYMMLNNTFGCPLWLTIVMVLLGLIMIALISTTLPTLPHWLHFLNIGAIPILALHGIAVGQITSYYSEINPTSPLYSTPGYALWSLIILVAFIPLIWIFDKYFPILCGKRK